MDVYPAILSGVVEIFAFPELEPGLNIKKDLTGKVSFHYFSGAPGRIRTPPLCGGISPSAQPADLVRILPENKKEVGSCLSGIISFYSWYAWQDSNLRPTD